MRYDFGISLRVKLKSLRLLRLLQNLVIFDDAIMDDRNTIIGNMRVCICLIRRTVGGPACMRYADIAMTGC